MKGLAIIGLRPVTHAIAAAVDVLAARRAGVRPITVLASLRSFPYLDPRALVHVVQRGPTEVIRTVSAVRNRGWEGSYVAVVADDATRSAVENREVVPGGKRFGELPGHSVLAEPVCLPDLLAWLEGGILSREEWFGLWDQSTVAQIGAELPAAAGDAQALRHCLELARDVDWGSYLPHSRHDLVRELLALLAAPSPEPASACRVLHSLVVTLLPVKR
jgi:hypothetical protein